ncbi:uncharacterized protein LOC125032608 isoform X2 [Penaeus chinensis]|uniref:uncharacterized protein LOC125032608 isoform X2 n=1 Tax=Penaeus chinensis TaxID=139456 RepID=UPI001FB5B71E|nr:uncharacterized protein LOC125032608 isoform X2 [Penaeus chinensis]
MYIKYIVFTSVYNVRVYSLSASQLISDDHIKYIYYQQLWSDRFLSSVTARREAILFAMISGKWPCFKRFLILLLVAAVALVLYQGALPRTQQFYGKSALDSGRDNLFSEQTRTMYPGWVVWLFTDPRGRENVLCPLLRDFPHFYICDVTQLPSLGNVTSIHNMIWRTLPLGDERVSAFFVRDTDSLLLERGAAAVREWMSGNKSFHLLRDHPYHGIPVMGGLWGARWDLKTHNVSEFRKNLTGVRSAMIKAAKGKFKKGVDQHILMKVLYPKTKGDVMSHDSFFCKKYPDGFRPFPIQREKGHYLRNYMGVRENDKLFVKTPCPEACRPKNHQDWTYC